MSKIGPKDSEPELFIRSMIHRMGYRFRLHRKELPGTPDLVFPKYNSVIFVHGCYWHGHEDCDKATIPDTNSDFWKEKISMNKERDKRNLRELKDLGWDSMVIWQCQIKKGNVPKLKELVSDFLSSD